MARVQRRALVNMRGMGCLETILNPIPDLDIDDCEFGAFTADDIMFLARAGQAISRIRVSPEPVPTIDDPADISFVAKHPITLLGVAPDRDVDPIRSRRGGDAFLVEVRCDFAS